MRPSKDETWIRIARELAAQSTCLRRHVGCVLIDTRGHVDGTGWNGNAAGEKHCNERDLSPDEPTYPNACSGARAASGTNLDWCEAIHAEQNALLQCSDPWMLRTCYCTASPCMTCTKLLLNTGCQRIVFLEDYPHNDAARKLWEKAGREWIKIEAV